MDIDILGPAFLIVIILGATIGYLSSRKDYAEGWKKKGYHAAPLSTTFSSDPIACVPLNYVGVTDAGEIRLSGEVIDLRSTTFHRVKIPSKSYKVPGHPVKVSWTLPEHRPAILAFHRSVPSYRRPYRKNMLLYEEEGPGLFPRKEFYLVENYNERDFLLEKVAECLSSHGGDLKSLFTQYGVLVKIDEHLPAPPPPPPPPPPPKGVQIAPEVYIEDRFRDKHIYLLGKSGKGKTTLMLNMARQDIESGKGVIVIDPHGETADRLLQYVPEHRVPDTIYFNPATCPVGLSSLNAEKEDERALIVDDCVVLFKRLSESWGPRMNAIILYTVHTLMRYPGATFLDIGRLLTNAAWRKHVVETVNDPDLISFWEQEYPLFPRDAASPITTRMAMFLLSPYVRSTFGSASGFRFYDHMQKGGIFIANISGIGEEASQLIGSILVSQIQLVVMRRAKISEDQRTPSHLYVDEFQEFQSSAFGKIITGARKFKLYLTVANQKLADLSPETYSSIEGVETSIYFNLYPSDARHIASAVPIFKPEDFMNLDEGEVIIRPARVSDSFKVQAALPPKPVHNHAAEIIRNTQERYGPAPADLDPTETRDDEPRPSRPPS